MKGHLRRVAKLLMQYYFQLFPRAVQPRGGKQLLLVRLDAIGDYVLFRNCIAAVKQSDAYSDHSLTLLGNAVWKDLALTLDQKDVDTFIWCDKRRFNLDLAYRFHFLSTISVAAYDVVISPMQSREFFVDAIIRLVRADQKIGCRGDGANTSEQIRRIGDRSYTRLIPTDPKKRFEFNRNQAFFETLLGEPVRRARPHIAYPDGAAPSTLPARYTVLFIGASAAWRKWRPDRFAALAEHLQRTYGDAIVLCGAASDADDVALFLQCFEGECIDLVGKTTLVELLHVIGHAAFMVTNETSAPHCAVALGSPPMLVLSNGNHFGRFTPYPKQMAPHYHALYPPMIASKRQEYEVLCQAYGGGSDLDINGITVSDAIRSIHAIRGGTGLPKREDAFVLFSVITIAYNAVECIEATLRSVLDQTYANVQYIVIDGGSTDGTAAVIGRYDARIDYWVSEPDKGISDAFNKGIQAAKGEYLLMLNAGDVLSDASVLQRHADAFGEHDLVVFHTRAQGSARQIGIDSFAGKSVTQRARLPHQGTFVHRCLYARFGGYDTAITLRMDYEFFLRVTSSATAQFIPETLAYYDDTGISGQVRHRMRYEIEGIMAEYRHVGGWWRLLPLLWRPSFMTAASWLKRRIWGKRGETMKRKNVLLFHSWGLGDTIMLTPALSVLAQTHATEVLTTTALNKTLLGAVSELKAIHLHRGIWQLVRFCLSHFGRYDALAGSAGIRPVKVRLLALLLGAKYIAPPRPIRNEHRIMRNVRILQPLIGAPNTVPDALLPSLPALANADLLDPRRPSIGFSVGSKLSQAYKRWGVENFIAVARAFPEVNCLFFVGPEEQEEKRVLVREHMKIVEMPLMQSMACIAQLDLLVGNDNGLMHVGYAAGIKTFTLFGMTNSREIGGYGARNHAHIVGLECQPCLDSVRNGVCAELSCLRTLSQESVIARIKEIMGW